MSWDSSIAIIITRPALEYRGPSGGLQSGVEILSTEASVREGRGNVRKSKAMALFIAALFVSAGFAVMLEAFQAPGVSAAGVPTDGPSPVFAAIAAGKVGHAPFRVNSDMDLAAKAAANGWPGDGTVGNPFLIQNLDINANDTGAGIFIGNVSKHFKIQGCVVQNAVSTGSVSLFSGAGIQIYNTANGTINACYVSHNNYGVMVRDGSHDISVTNNILTHNSQAGLQIQGYFSSRLARILVQGNDCSHPSNYCMYIQYADHVTTTQNNVSFGNYGIYASNCNFLSVTWNTAIKSSSGLYLDHCYGSAPVQASGVRVENNTVYNSNSEGITLYADRYGRASNNTLFMCSMGLGGGAPEDFGRLTITPDNTVNGRIVRYYHNGDMSAVTVPANAGEVIAGNVTNLHVSGLSISNSTGGVMLYQTQGSTISGCTFTNMFAYAIYAYSDPFLNVNGCTFVNVRVGVHFRYSDNSRIVGNTMTGVGYEGLQAVEDDNCLIANNVISSTSYYSTYAVYLDGDSSNDTLWSNQMTRCGLGMYPNEYYAAQVASQHITVNNTVNGNPLVYLANVDLAWASVGTNIGQLFLANVSRAAVDSLQIGNLSEPVEIAFSNNVTLTNGFFGYASYAVWAAYSENITVDTCAIAQASYGVYCEYTNDCTLQNSMITGCSYDVYLAYGSGYNIAHNRLATSGTGVYAYRVSVGLIDHNNFSGSGSYALYPSYVSEFVVSNNNLSGSPGNTISYGVYSNFGSGNTYIGNVLYNAPYGIYEYYGKKDKFFSNTMTHGGFYLGGGIDFTKTVEIAPNNTIGGKPVYMYKNGDFTGVVVPTDAAQIIVVNVTGLVISGITFSSSVVQQVYVNSLGGVTITGCTFNGWYYSVYMENCVAVSVNGNLFNGGSYGVYVYSGSENRIEGNNFSSCYIGVYLSYAPNNLVNDNDWLADTYAMFIYSAPSNRIFDNRMYRTSIYLSGSRDTYVTQTIPINNTVNGKKVYYYKNQNMGNASVPSDAGAVILGNVSNVVLSGLILNNASLGVNGGYCTNVKVLNCDLRNSRYFAVSLWYSTGCTVSGNRFDNGASGVYLYYSNWNTISGNAGKSIGSYGVYGYYADANTISGNNFNNTYYGVQLYYSIRNQILGNTFGYGYYGVYFSSSDANYLHGNLITHCTGYGVYLTSSSDSNLVTGNNIASSYYYGVYINTGSESNMFYANRLANNNGATSTYNAGHIQAYDNDANAWNSTAHSGNLWTDWLYPDANHDGIVDQPYVLAGSGGSKDYFPLSDVEPPVLSITSPANGTHFTNPHVNVTWTAYDNDSGLSYVEVRVGLGAWQNASLNPNATVTLTVGGSNVISVRAWDKAGNFRVKSVSVVFVTVPAAITDLHAESTMSMVHLTWTAPNNGSSPLTHYYVYRSTTSGSYGAPLQTVTPSGSSMMVMDDSGLVTGTRYYYVVKTQNALGNSTLSNEATVVFGGQPDQVTGLSSSATSTLVTVTWTAPNDHGSPITKYVIYRSLTSSGGTVYGNSTTTSFTDSSVTSGQTYHYWVVAQNANGVSTMSAETHVTVGGGGGTTDNTVLLIAGILVVIVIIAGVGVAMMRRKK